MLKAFLRRWLFRTDPFADPRLQTFCALPWTHYFISETGNHYPCCISTDSGLPNVDADGTAFTIDDERALTASWNSDYMRDIRAKMLSGRRPVPCETCFKHEDLGLVSRRYWANSVHAQLALAIADDTAAAGTVPLRIHSADIRLGNKCNLRCRMCNPGASKGLLIDWRNLQAQDRSYYESPERYPPGDWYESEEFWDMLSRHSHELKELHFAGGEPFLVPEHFEFLRRLISQGQSSRIVISYNTNLTVLPPELRELWKRFRGARVQVSIDGTRNANRYIRYPSNWDEIQSHVRELHDHLDDYNVHALDFGVTVQMYNAFDTPALIEFLLTEYPRAHYPTLTPVFHPRELSLQVAPPAMKAELTRLWRAFLEARRESLYQGAAWRPMADNLVNAIEGIVEFMNASDESALLPRFVERTRIFDATRYQSCPEWIPELAALFESDPPHGAI